MSWRRSIGSASTSGRSPKFRQHPIRRFGDIRQSIEQRAVQVDGDRVDVEFQTRNTRRYQRTARPHTLASSERIAAIVAL